MKFVISSSALSARLSTIGRVIVQKNNLPILDCFCFDIHGTQLTITASDSNTTLVTTLELNECDSDARFAVNAKTIQDSIKEIPEQPLEFYLNLDTYEMTVEYQNGQYKLMAQNAEEYPVLSVSEGEDIHLTLGAQQLLAGLNRSIVAAANDMLRPQLCAVCFDVREDGFSLVASNGNHLAMTKYSTGAQEKQGVFLLNTRPAGLLRNMLSKEQEDVQMKFGERSATFISSEYSMTSRLVDGNYPNYRSVIPQDNPHVVTLNRLAFISALRRTLIFASASSVLVKFSLSTNTLQLSTQDLDFGKSADETVLCDFMGNPMRIAFKGSTLLDLVQNIEAENITLKLSDPSRAGIIVPAEQNENEEVLMLIMPSVFND